MQFDEVRRIKRRVEKCKRRIAVGYVAPVAYNVESEEERLARLVARLFEIEEEAKDAS